MTRVEVCPTPAPGESYVLPEHSLHSRPSCRVQNSDRPPLTTQPSSPFPSQGRRHVSNTLSPCTTLYAVSEKQNVAGATISNSGHDCMAPACVSNACPTNSTPRGRYETNRAGAACMSRNGFIENKIWVYVHTLSPSWTDGCTLRN